VRWEGEYPSRILSVIARLLGAGGHEATLARAERLCSPNAADIYARATITLHVYKLFSQERERERERERESR
jgi:hypothetical protein